MGLKRELDCISHALLSHSLGIVDPGRMGNRTQEASRLNPKHNARPHLARMFPVGDRSFVPMIKGRVPVWRARGGKNHTDKFTSYSSLSYPYTCMTNISDFKASRSDVKTAPPEAIARWENEGGAPGRPERDKVTSWFVPPIVVPAFLIALIVARAAYLACLD